MTYVISDIHGGLDSYLRMLRLIEFSRDDRLIILGDICDRGNDSAEIYLDLMQRKNVTCLKGNHELMAESVLPYMFSLESKPSRSQYKANYQRWMDNGGESTLLSLYRYSDSARLRILDYISQSIETRISFLIADFCYYIVKILVNTLVFTTFFSRIKQKSSN